MSRPRFTPGFLVTVVPYSPSDVPSQAIRHLLPLTHGAKRVTGKKAVVVLPRQRSYTGQMEGFVKGRTTTTERSRNRVASGSPVVAYCPTLKGLQLAQQLAGSWLGVVAWIDPWFKGWARFMGATDARSGNKCEPLGDEALEAIADIEWSGNNGWDKRDSLTTGQAQRGAELARAAGLTSNDIFGAMVAQGHGVNSIERLMGIIGED